MPINVNALRRVAFALSIFSAFVQAGPLSQLCQKGLNSHPNIRSSLYQEQSKRYVTRQGKDQYLPQISLNAEKGYKKYYYEKVYSGENWRSNNYYSYTFSLSQALYQPVLLKKIDDARQREILAHYQTQDNKAKLTTQIAQTTIELMRLYQIRALAKKKAELYRKALEQIQAKYKSKFADVSAVAQAKARLRQSEAEYAQYNQNYHYILQNLRYLTNSKKIPSVLKRAYFNAMAVALHYHANDLKKHLKQIKKNTRVKIYTKYRDIAKNMIDMRFAEHYPSLSVKASYNDGNFGDPTDPRKNSKISLQVNLPLYEGGYVRDRVNEAQALYYAAVQDLDNALLESRSSMEKNWEQIQTGLQTLKALREAEKASKVYYETSLNAYKNGLQSLTDTYQANIDYYDTKVKRINAEADLLSSILNLYYVAGVATPTQIAKFEKRYLR